MISKYNVHFLYAMIQSSKVIESASGLLSVYIKHHAIYTNLLAIAAIAVYVYALLEKRRKSSGTLSWKQGFMTGLSITVIITLLSP